MKKNKIVKFAIFLGLLYSLTGCKNENNNEAAYLKKSTEPASIATTNQSEPVLSYEQYQNLIQAYGNKIIIPEFTLKAWSGVNMVIVDKDLTFGKRQTLTLEGTLNTANVKPTSSLFIFENDKSDKQILVRISFHDKYIGEDLMDWSFTSGYEKTNKKFDDLTDMATLIYKNLIITVQQVSFNGVSSDLTKVAVRENIKLLKNY